MSRRVMSIPNQGAVTEGPCPDRACVARALCLVFAAVGSLGIVPADGSARQVEAPYITVLSPAGWGLDPDLVEPGVGVPQVDEGDSIPVRGRAFHPEGVLRVEVDGESMALSADPLIGDVWVFEGRVIARSGQTSVVITVVPRNGPPFIRTFPVQVMERVDEEPPTPVRPEDPPLGEMGPGEDGPSQSVHQPWRGVRRRGIAYVAVAGGGAFLALRETSSSFEFCETVAGVQDCWLRTETSRPQATLGAGLIAAAVVIGVVDVILAARSPSPGASAQSARAMELGSGNDRSPFRWSVTFGADGRIGLSSRVPFR